MQEIREDDIETQADRANSSGILGACLRKVWSLGWLKVQMGQLTIDYNTTYPPPEAPNQMTLDLRLRAIKLLFGLPGEHVQHWPGILLFCSHLEHSFGSLVSNEFDIIWKILNRPKSTDPVECWHWCFAVIEAFLYLQADDAVSIENAYQRLIVGTSRLPADYTTREKDHALIAIFAVLCWLSMILKPVLPRDHCDPTDSESQLSFRAEGSSQVALLQAARRPVAKMFRELRDHPGDPGAEPAMTDTTNMDVLYESGLNFYSLYTIGRIRLKWVDTLSSHLAFDRQNHTLSIFRLPSFSASSILRTQDTKALQQIASELLPSDYYPDTSHQDPASLHREVLLSYRLLFGQSSHSRVLLTDLLAQLKKASKEVDPFLISLCTTPLSPSFFSMRRSSPMLPSELFPSSSLDINNLLMESDAYSARDDFPTFGSRLAALQRYNLRQQPRRMRDLWRDRRNPLQWYTFWAVLVIGGPSIIIGLLQLFASGWQIYIAAQQQK
ncbi:hypothetical protein VE03_09672 [Pseudogymnoascus sp. 23342-1-I1]|nr:hypothetical protein VE03_09672 [Pseudogymnoascus sp. 23342-1-I1]